MSTDRGRKRASRYVDPYADPEGRSKRKLRQLCRQVERALSTALSEQDPDQLDVALAEVLPWPNASRLLVVVEPVGQGGPPRHELLERLEERRGELRDVVSSAIHRKRAPELCFEVRPPLFGATQAEPS